MDFPVTTHRVKSNFRDVASKPTIPTSGEAIESKGSQIIRFDWLRFLPGRFCFASAVRSSFLKDLEILNFRAKRY